MKVTLTAKNSAVKICDHTFETGDVMTTFIQEMEREVNLKPQKVKLLIKEWMQRVSKIQTMCSSILVFAPQSLIPPEVVQTLILVLVITFFLGIVIAVFSLMAAGIWKMTFGKTRADEWTKDIFKGVGQVVLAPIVISLIVMTVMYLFGNLPVFKPFKDPINVFFHSL